MCIIDTKKFDACGTVDSTVASNTRGTGFDSSHHKISLNNYLLLTVSRKVEKTMKELV